MYLKLYKQNYLPLWARGTHTQMHKLCKHPANSRAPSIISTSQEIKFHWAISHWIIFTTLTITCPYKGATHTGTSSHTLSAGWVLSVLRGFLRTASSLMAFVCVCVCLRDALERQMVCFCVKHAGKNGKRKERVSKNKCGRRTDRKWQLLYSFTAFFFLFFVFSCSAVQNLYSLQNDQYIHLFEYFWSTVLM